MYVPPIVERYNYEPIRRIEGDGSRLYATCTGNLPSVTTILSATSDTTSLDNWRAFVGNEKANTIVNEACAIGTLMHENLENRLIGKPDHQGGMPMRVLGRRLADCIQENAWGKIDEVWGQEVALYYEGLWAGTTDLVGVHQGIESIMDYKNSKRKKTWSKIENYRLQCAAYALAHNQMFGTNIQRGVIFVAVREDPKNPQYQEFIVEGEEFEKAKDEWIKRVELYYKIIGEI